MGRKIFRIKYVATAIVFIALYFVGCSQPDKIYRLVSPIGNSDCKINIPTENKNWDYSVEAENCSIQKLSLPAINENDNKESYKLAFLEFNENSGDLFDAKQLDSIRNLLRSHKNKFVVVFVHGWRHDAAVGNEDVRRFRTLLAYSKKFLSQRKTIPEDTELIGIYVGWRGSSVKEYGLGVAPALPTIWNRKALSEKLAPTVISNLEEIQEISIHQSQPNSFNKMLLVGHSLGGNMLMTGLGTKAAKKLEDHAMGDNFLPLLGNLTVLLNPASEASKWIKLQRKMREVTNTKLMDDNPSNSAWRKMFPLTQKPVLISLTAASNWSKKETKGAKIEYDWPTAVAFPLAHFYRSNRKEKVTIGHYDPDYPIMGENSNLPQKDPYGTTHELILNKSTGLPTNLTGLLDPNRYECTPATGWLLKTRKRAIKFGQGWAKWDTGHKTDDPNGEEYALLPYSKKDQSRHSQYRRGLSLPGGGVGVRRAMVPRNSPFWNTRVFNSIEDHGGYVNAPTWCLINQMVLDDITSGN